MTLAAFLLACHLLAIAAPVIFGLPPLTTALLVVFFWLGFFGCNLTQKGNGNGR